METLQPEDIKKLNEAVLANENQIDYLIDKNFERGFEKGREFERNSIISMIQNQQASKSAQISNLSITKE